MAVFFIFQGSVGPKFGVSNQPRLWLDDQRGRVRVIDSGKPFRILGLDIDNGGEFRNETLVTYCVGHGIELTRSRPYRKNDQAWVEQKNGSATAQCADRGLPRTTGPPGHSPPPLGSVLRVWRWRKVARSPGEALPGGPGEPRLRCGGRRFQQFGHSPQDSPRNLFAATTTWGRTRVRLRSRGLMPSLPTVEGSKGGLTAGVVQ
jgi:hypothetical protein